MDYESAKLIADAIIEAGQYITIGLVLCGLVGR